MSRIKLGRVGTLKNCVSTRRDKSTPLLKKRQLLGIGGSFNIKTLSINTGTSSGSKRASAHDSLLSGDYDIPLSSGFKEVQLKPNEGYE